MLDQFDQLVRWSLYNLESKHSSNALSNANLQSGIKFCTFELHSHSMK